MEARRNLPQSGHDSPVQSPSALPDLKTIPAPISYGNAHAQPATQPLARSFSQRARERKMARTLPRHTTWDEGDHGISQKKGADSVPRSSSTKYHTSSTSPAQEYHSAVQNRVEPSYGGPLSPSQQESVESSLATQPASQSFVQPLRKQRNTAPPQSNSKSTNTQANGTAHSYASNVQNRDWASHRSPLQTLEGKLNDISKEEKRARVQEAEMLLRESKAGCKDQPASKTKNFTTSDKSPGHGNKAADFEQQANLTPAASLGGSKIVQTGTMTSRTKNIPHPDVGDAHARSRHPADNTHKSRSTDPSHKPSLQPGPVREDDSFLPQEPFEGYGVPASSRMRPGRSVSNATPSSPRKNTERKFNPAIQEGTNVDGRDIELAYQQTANPISRQAPQRSLPLTHAVQSNITRAVSLQSAQPQPFFSDDQDTGRTGVMRDSNSSHRAALAEPATSSNTHEYYGRKLQKARPRAANKTFPARAAQMPRMDPPEHVEERPFLPQGDTETGDTRPNLSYRYMSRLSQLDNSASSPGPDRQPGREGDLSPEEPIGSTLDYSLWDSLTHLHSHNDWRTAEVGRLTLEDLDLNLSQRRAVPWWEKTDAGGRPDNKSVPKSPVAEAYNLQDNVRRTEFQPPLYLLCGPLLRYLGIRTERAAKKPGETLGAIKSETWRGTVMIVTRDSYSSYQEPPILRLFSQPKDLLPPPPEEVQGNDLDPAHVDPIAGTTKVSRRGQTLYVKPVDQLEEGKDLSRFENDDGLFEAAPTLIDGGSFGSVHPNNRTSSRDGEFLQKYREVKGFRLYQNAGFTFWRFALEVELGHRQAHIAYRINHGPPMGFWVPAKGQSMNIMFHSCNGFSLSTNPDQFGGPDPLWRDVLNTHQSTPFHVMVGGGDQIYNDGVMVETTQFREWTSLKNSSEKRDAPFTSSLRFELETFYMNRYVTCFSHGLFGLANAQIPMVNIYDDHDIIDGFGSYPDDFQNAPVFRGLGQVAFKYYMLFQHQSLPSETQNDEPSWVLGAKPGPYIEQVSRSVFMHFGRSVAFLGVDCRTEREVCPNCA